MPWHDRVRPGDLGVGDLLPAAPDDERLVPLVVLEGDGLIGGDRSPVHAGDVVWLTRTDDDGLSELNIIGGTAPLRVLLYAGRPLGEPVVARGPFVMNTEEQIRQANIDYREGRFEPGGR